MDSGDETSDLLERAKAGDASAAAPHEAEASQRGGSRRGGGLLLGLVFAGMSGIVAFLLAGGEESDPFVYSQTIDDVTSDPAAHLGRTLRVEGMLKNGSVLFREEPCEWRFVLEGERHEMPVEFPQCVVPDTFRDGMGISVVVEGQLRDDGSFLASQVIPRCPSRYEMEQRQQAGEAVPHGPMPEQSSLGAPRPPS